MLIKQFNTDLLDQKSKNSIYRFIYFSANYPWLFLTFCLCTLLLITWILFLIMSFVQFFAKPLLTSHTFVRWQVFENSQNNSRVSSKIRYQTSVVLSRTLSNLLDEYFFTKEHALSVITLNQTLVCFCSPLKSSSKLWNVKSTPGIRRSYNIVVHRKSNVLHILRPKLQFRWLIANIYTLHTQCMH